VLGFTHFELKKGGVSEIWWLGEGS